MDGEYSLPHGRILVILSFTVFDAKTGKTLREFESQASAVTELIWSPDRKRILLASRDGGVKIWNTNTGKELQTIKPKKELIATARNWSPNGKYILSVDSNVLKIWNLIGEF